MSLCFLVLLSFFHAIKMKIRTPKFIIHDGIFDSMDKAHFISLYNFLKEENISFQYIITLNEEGDLDKKFGNFNKITSEVLEIDSIITLTPSNKLFGKNF